MFGLVGTAEAGTAIVPIVAALTVLVGSLQAAGGSFVALKCCWLGILWRRGTEHGMDSFIDVGVSAALIVGSTAIGAAVAGAAGFPLTPALAGGGAFSEIVGDLVGHGLAFTAMLGPGLYLRRRQLRGFWQRVRRVMRAGR